MPASTRRIGLSITLLALAAVTPAVAAPVITPAFQDYYSITADLGQYPLFPFGGNYSALCFSSTDPNTLLIGAQVTELARGIVPATVARNASGHITGFSGITGNFAYASPNINGGLAYGPNGVLFATTYPDNLLYQYKPGSFERDKIIDLGALGVYPSTGSVAFVPAGYPGAGGIRFIQVWPFGRMYTADLTPDGNGTFNVSNVSPVMEFGGGNSPEQMLWVPPNSPGFDDANKHVQVANYGSQRVAAYQLDANGHPNFGTQLAFMTGLVGSIGAVVDPLTGDFLFSTYGDSGAGDHIYVVSQTAASIAPTGDYNLNGIVDAADYVLWRKTLGQPASPAGSGADGNSSGTIDADDYGFWRARIGNVIPTASGSLDQLAIPEPASASLVMAGLLAMAWRSSRTRPEKVRKSGHSGIPKTRMSHPPSLSATISRSLGVSETLREILRNANLR